MDARPALSFCIITAGVRPQLLETVVRSIRAQGIPEFEVIVVGDCTSRADALTISVPEHAASGRLGVMRNLAAAAARHENLVMLDDDVVLAPDWYESFGAYPGTFDILTCQVRLPDGSRYWDHATCGGPLGHRILAPDEQDPNVYMTGGGGWVMKQRVSQTVRWDESRGFYQGEDVDFAQRCRQAGFEISHNHSAVVFHADASYTTVGRLTFQRTERRVHDWVESELCGLGVDELVHLVVDHMNAQRFAEMADCLRYGLEQHPESRQLAEMWRTLEGMLGGRLPDARWSSQGDPAFREAMAVYGGAPTLGPDRAGPRRVAAALGINLFGFLSGNLGLGVSARNYLRLLLEADIPVHPVDVEVCGGRSGHDATYAEMTSTLDQASPYPVNLFVMSPPDIVDLLGCGPTAIRTSNRLNTCLCFWELARLPKSWVPMLEAFDVSIAASGFIRYAMLADLSRVAVPYVPQPVYVEQDIVPDRGRWGIPADSPVFLCAFEMASDISRKNPLGAIECFSRAFGSHDDATLIIKVNNSRWMDCFAPHMAELRARAERDPRVILIDDVLSYRDVLSLYASADVFVSLHRAEGFGHPTAEAMTLGRPVISTAWSGNMDYMTERNACLVGYSLVPVRGSTQEAYSRENIGANARWAEPDLDEAADWMRRLAEDADLRERIGKQAALDMSTRQRGIDVSELSSTLDRCWGRIGSA
ncbi:MAG: glycosyltransferase [Myxococcota bacterium]